MCREIPSKVTVIIEKTDLLCIRVYIYIYICVCVIFCILFQMSYLRVHSLTLHNVYVYMDIRTYVHRFIIYIISYYIIIIT